MSDTIFDTLDEHGSRMLAEMLLDDVLLMNSRHWRNEDKQLLWLGVLCSDTFGYACADAEDLPYEEIPNLYALWQKNHVWGPTAWCVRQRKTMPIRPVAEGLRAHGFDVDTLVRGEMPWPTRS